MTKPSEKRLSGKEAEDWFKRFSQQEGIASRVDVSLEKTVRLLHQKLNTRLRSALLYDAKMYPDREFVDRIIEGRSPNIPKQRKDAIQDKLLDLVVATDDCITLKDKNGQSITIAVDVTINSSKEQEKIDRVRGLPEFNDKPGTNRNKNIPDVRKAFGIRKHLVVVMDNKRSLLPSHQRLITELKAFAEKDSLTASLNLTNLSLKETLGQEKLDPSQTYKKIYPAHQHLEGVERLKAIAQQCIRQGHDTQFTQSVLMNDKFMKKFSNQTIAVSTAGNISAKELENNPEQQAYRAAKYLVRNIEPNLNGIQEYKGEKYLIQAQQNDLTIKALDGRETIFEMKKGRCISQIQPNDLENFKTVNKISKAETQKQTLKPSLKPKQGPEL